MTLSVRRGAAAATTALLLALAAGACTDDGSAGEPPPTAEGTGAGEPAVRTTVTWGSVTGHLPRDARERVAERVGAVVDGWVHAAYVDGTYPRRDFSTSWPGFTAGARQLAHRDRDLMSNEDIGERIDGVELRRSHAVLDALAVRGHAVGVTARVTVGFGTTGDLERTVRVQGQLHLTPTDHGWRVFGYDVSKGAL